MSPTPRIRTWALVADAARARILLNVAKGDRLHPVIGGDFANPDAHQPSHELGSDRPGRGHASVGAARHGEEPRSDPHREVKRHFAAEICEFLEKAAREQRFDRLVIIAPPQMLGDLRAHLGPMARERVAAEIDKDLTQLPAGELAERVQAALP